MAPKPKPVRGAASRATTRSKSGSWLVQKPTLHSSLNIDRSRQTYKTAGDDGIFGDRRVLKPRQLKPRAEVDMLDPFVKRVACVVMFWKARIEEEDVETYFNGSVKNSEWEFKVVAEKMAKLEKTNVFWPASLKQLVHKEPSRYRETGEGDSYNSMSETQKGEFWVSRYTEDQARNYLYPLDKTIDVDYIITNEPWKSFAQAYSVTSYKEIYENRVSVNQQMAGGRWTRRRKSLVWTLAQSTQPSLPW